MNNDQHVRHLGAASKSHHFSRHGLTNVFLCNLKQDNPVICDHYGSVVMCTLSLSSFRHEIDFCDVLPLVVREVLAWPWRAMSFGHVV